MGKKIKTMLKYMAVDYDGTLCVHIYPAIGEEIPNAFEVIKKYQELGVKIILFTMRSGKELLEAIEWCKERGLEFYGINTNPTQKFWTASPKAYADIFVDDAAAGCPLIYEDGKRPYVNWLEVDKIITERIKLNAY